MSQFPNQPPYNNQQPPQGQPYQGQYQQPPQGQPYQGQYQQPPQGQPYQGQYQQPPQGQPYQGQYQQPPQSQPYQAQPSQFGQQAQQIVTNFKAPAPIVTFSAQAAVAIFLSYIFLLIVGATPLIQISGSYSYFGVNYGSSFSLNLEGLIPLVGALIVFLQEKTNSFVKFHAAQALILGITWVVVEIIIGLLSGAGTAIYYLNTILFVAYAALVAYTIYRATYKSEVYKLPGIGGIAQNMSGPVSIS